MGPRVRQASQAQRRQSAVLRRDDALARLTTASVAIAVATITAVGALGLYVAKALPGHAATPTGSVAGSRGTAGGAATGGTGNSGASGPSAGAPAGGSSQVTGPLQPPSTPVQGTPIRPRVTSGAS